jgi:hypothetical protein
MSTFLLRGDNDRENALSVRLLSSSRVDHVYYNPKPDELEITTSGPVRVPVDDFIRFLEAVIDRRLRAVDAQPGPPVFVE